MAIADDILALAPLAYWKLDDPSGPAASDSSGNGHPGAYSGGFTLGQWGPEPGTHAAQFAVGAGINAPLPAIVHTQPWTVLFYAATNWATSPATATHLWIGNIPNSRGFGVGVDNSNARYYIAVFYGVASSTTGAYTQTADWNRYWHCVAWTYDGVSAWTPFSDGSAYSGFTQINMRDTLTNDPLSVTAGAPTVMAHLALFNKVLTQPQIAQIASHRMYWPFMPAVGLAYPVIPGGGGTGNLNPSDPIVIDMTGDLTNIYNAVHRDYPQHPGP